MKFTLTILSFILTCAAYADPACTALSSVVGKYELTEIMQKGCDDRFARAVKDLDVRQEDGYVSIWVGGIGIGPSTSSNSTDRCTVENDKIVVQTCYKSASCLPQHWYYTFTKDSAEYQANGCYFRFKKIN